MSVSVFVEEMKQTAVRELLAASAGGQKTEQTHTFKAGRAHLITVRGGAIEKASIAHLTLEGLRPPYSDEAVDGVVYQMEIFPENPFCPMGHFNTEWTLGKTTSYYTNLDLFPAVAAQSDLDDIRAVIDGIARTYSRDTVESRKGLAEQYHMAHWPGPLAAGVGLQLKGLQEKELGLMTDAYKALFEGFIGLLKKRKDQPVSPEDVSKKLERNGRWLEYITMKDRAVKMAQAAGIPAEVLIGLSFPPSAVF